MMSGEIADEDEVVEGRDKEELKRVKTSLT